MRWRRIDLKRVIKERFGVDYETRYGLFAHQRTPSSSGAGRTYYRRIRKNWPRTLKAHLCDLPPRTKVEPWFQDEARIGQKNGIVRQWARRGTRPRQPADQGSGSNCTPHPAFETGDGPHVMVTQFMAAIPRALLAV